MRKQKPTRPGYGVAIPVIIALFALISGACENPAGSGAKNKNAEIYMSGVGTGTIDWGDGAQEEVPLEVDTWSTHSYPKSATPSITITGVGIIDIIFTGMGSMALSVIDCPDLVYLDCGSNALTALTIQNCALLQELDCSGNKITELDVSGCTVLQTLDCSDNELTELDVSGCTVLQDFYCYENKIASLNIRGYTNLEIVDCSENELTILDAGGCTALEKLSCDKNAIAELDVSGCTVLERLSCESNKLTVLDLSDCGVLDILWGDNNLMEADDLNALFVSLPDTLVGGIYISGNPGAEACDRKIAEDKGWQFFSSSDLKMFNREMMNFPRRRQTARTITL